MEYVNPPAHTVVGSYLGALPRLDRSAIGRYARTLDQAGNRAFREAGFEGVMHVPVLGTEEDPEQTADTLRQLSEQVGNVAVVASVNAPRGRLPAEEKNRLRDNRELILDHARTTDVPMSAFSVRYKPKTSIGRVLRDPIAASLTHVLDKRGESMPNLLLGRSDVDRRGGSSNFLPDMMRLAGSIPGFNWMIFPTVQHDRLDPERYPNINRLLHWYDLEAKHTPKWLPAHFAVDAIGYCLAKGINHNPDLNIDEIRDLVGRMDSNDLGGRLRTFHLADSTVTASCRQLAGNVVEQGNMRYDSLVVPTPGTWSYRRELPLMDASDELYILQAVKIIPRSLRLIAEEFYGTNLERGMSHAKAIHVARASVAAIVRTATENYQEPPVVMAAIEAAIKEWRAP